MLPQFRSKSGGCPALPGGWLTLWVAVMTREAAVLQLAVLVMGLGGGLCGVAGSGLAQSRSVGGTGGIEQLSGDRLRDEELEMLARARAERAARGLSPAGEAADAAADPGEEVRRQAIDAEVAKRLDEAEREAELEQLSASIRRGAAGRAGEPLKAPSTSANDTAGIAQQPAAPPSMSATQPERATVLLVMQPVRSGIRALNPTADPILCMPDVCWISRGPEQDARMVPRRKALGPLNTLGGRAGACNDSVGCVFRNVEITGASAMLQPIDLRLVRHDRREPLELSVDRSCRATGGKLACSTGASGSGYRMLAVPEVVAQEAGGRALLTAVGTQMRAASHRLR